MNECKTKSIELAKKSIFRSRHGAVVYYNGHIVGSGFNVNFKHPEVEKFNEHKTLHAEMVAILRVKNKKILKKAELFVCRVNKDGKPMLSNPCPVCRQICKSFGLRTVHYTDINGNWITEQI